MSQTPDQFPGDVMCADTALPVPPTALFPPADADEDTRRAWIARSPWPEVVFASA